MQDMKGFRHGMQTASETSSQDLAMNSSSTPDDSTPESSRRPFHLVGKTQLHPGTPHVTPTSTPDHNAARKKRSRMVVPLAVLEEFSEGSGSREAWSVDELSEEAKTRGGKGGSCSSSCSSEAGDRLVESGDNMADASSLVESSASPAANVRARRSTFKRSRSQQKSMNGPVVAPPAVHSTASESCIVDLNSNAKDSGDRSVSPRRRYEELGRLILGHDDDDGEDGYDGDCVDAVLDGDATADEFAMLRFAEKYFNAPHVIHVGYPNAITKTMNIVTRKSLNVSFSQ